MILLSLVNKDIIDCHAELDSGFPMFMKIILCRTQVK